MAAITIFFWLPGCVQDTTETTDPMTSGQVSNMTLSGYTRAGVTFSGR
jgi:hypothetical protein